MASLTIAPSATTMTSSGLRPRAAATRTVLTARGRRVVAALIVVAAVLIAYALSGLLSAAVAAGDSGAVAEVSYVLVEPGDTLWSIASELDPTADPRALIDRIATLNALSSDAQLQVGQTIALPSSS